MSVNVVVVGILFSVSAGGLALLLGPQWQDEWYWPPLATSCVFLLTWLSGFWFFRPRQTNQTVRDRLIRGCIAATVFLGICYGHEYYDWTEHDVFGRFTKGTKISPAWIKSMKLLSKSKNPSMTMNPEYNLRDKHTRDSQRRNEWWLLGWWLPLAVPPTLMISVILSFVDPIDAQALNFSQHWTLWMMAIASNLITIGLFIRQIASAWM